MLKPAMATTYPVLRWQVGDARISRIVEMEGPSPGTFLFAEATPEKLLQHAWLRPHFVTDDGRLIGRREWEYWKNESGPDHKVTSVVYLGCSKDAQS